MTESRPADPHPRPHRTVVIRRVVVAASWLPLLLAKCAIAIRALGPSAETACASETLGPASRPAVPDAQPEHRERIEITTKNRVSEKKRMVSPP